MTIINYNVFFRKINHEIYDFVQSYLIFYLVQLLRIAFHKTLHLTLKLNFCLCFNSSQFNTSIYCFFNQNSENLISVADEINNNKHQIFAISIQVIFCKNTRTERPAFSTWKHIPANNFWDHCSGNTTPNKFNIWSQWGKNV